MNVSEKLAARELIVGNRSFGFLLADHGYDSGPLYDHAREQGVILMSPLSKNAGGGHRLQSKARLFARRFWDCGGEVLYKRRDAIERFLGQPLSLWRRLDATARMGASSGASGTVDHSECNHLPRAIAGQGDRRMRPFVRILPLEVREAMIPQSLHGRWPVALSVGDTYAQEPIKAITIRSATMAKAMTADIFQATGILSGGGSTSLRA